MKNLKKALVLLLSACLLLGCLPGGVSAKAAEPTSAGVDFSLSETSHDFGSQAFAYTTAPSATITVTNTGSEPTGRLTVELTTDCRSFYEVSPAAINSIPVGGSATFTAKAKLGLGPGTHLGTIEVSNYNRSVEKTISLTYTVTKTSDILVSTPDGNKDVEAIFGYTTAPQLKLLVKNTGGLPTGAMTASLQDGTTFSLASTAIQNLPSRDSGIVYIPITIPLGLPVGTYSDTVTVQNETGTINKTMAFSFTVKPVPTYELSLDQTGSINFTDAQVGYDASALTPLSVTITNTGNQRTGWIAIKLGKADTGFKLSKSNTSGKLDPDATETFTVVPKTGLTAGTYTDTVTVSDAANEVSASFDVSFTVTPAPTFGGADSPTSYSILTEECEHGKLTASQLSAQPGATVTVSAEPDEHYRVDTVTVTDRSTGQPLELTRTAEGDFTFEMPSASVTVSGTFAWVNPFADLPENAYYRSAAEWALNRGLLTAGKTLQPGAPSTRAEVVSYLWAAAGKPAPTGTQSPFTDLDPSAAYYNAVLWAAEHGITAGVGNGKFAPQATCTRGQMVTFLANYEQAMGGDIATDGGCPFTDVPGWCKPAVTWCYHKGITSGTAETKFSPNQNCTRAQSLVLLYRYFGQGA